MSWLSGLKCLLVKAWKPEFESPAPFGDSKKERNQLQMALFAYKLSIGEGKQVSAGNSLASQPSQNHELRSLQAISREE